ncbi:type II toxin-antitoxin system VapC family toxin [Portibacter marinus]|uniref:type II toxin-antitoxin system VapC family toxin n=1 Tax=Portibacter marinus TaxID=2898660 RepID=UPI001F189A17|nr:PIN domain-containing protein [Portibacter marinus]
MNLFLDTNILIDLTANRLPFSKWAIKIFMDAKEGKYHLITSTFSMLTCYYIIERQIGSKRTKKVIRILLNRIQTQDVSRKELLTALTTKVEDYEDAVQHECAKLCNSIDAIITRNKKDFKHSIIKVLSPEELYLGDKATDLYTP